MITGHFAYYHGDGINPRHLSLWERYVMKWHRHYDPVMDAKHQDVQLADELK